MSDTCTCPPTGRACDSCLRERTYIAALYGFAIGWGGGPDHTAVAHVEQTEDGVMEIRGEEIWIDGVKQ